MVPVVGLDLRCGAGHLGLKRAAGTFLSALGFEFHSCKKDSAPVGRCPFLSKDYKKDFFGVFVYDFEPSPKVS